MLRDNTPPASGLQRLQFRGTSIALLLVTLTSAAIPGAAAQLVLPADLTERSSVQPPPRMLKRVKRQVNPAAFSGVTDQISGLGQSASDKAGHATAGLNRTQTALVIVFCIIGFVLLVTALFWICSYSRRKKRAREAREKSQNLRQSSSFVAQRPQSISASSSFNSTKNKNQPTAPTQNEGWGESRVALNSSFLHSNNEIYGWQHTSDGHPVSPAPHHAHAQSAPLYHQPLASTHRPPSFAGQQRPDRYQYRY